MIILHFEEYGHKIEINYKLLKVIVDNIPKDSQYSQLVDAIFELDILSLNISLAENGVLSISQRDRLWDTGDLAARRALVSDDEFLKEVNDKQAQEIINIDDAEMLIQIANYCELLYPEKGSQQASRLSGAMADSLLEHMAQHPEVSIRQSLAENSETPDKFRPTIADMLNIGTRRWYRQELSNINNKDVQALKNADREILDYCAQNIEDVKNASLRRELAEFIASHPDTGLRISLAENTLAPIFILRKLLNDADADVIASAKKSLEEQDAFDFDDDI